MSITLARIKYFIYYFGPLELLFLLYNSRKSVILTKFCNPAIPGLKHCQSWDSGLAKTAGIPGFGIPGLQSLQKTNETLYQGST